MDVEMTLVERLRNPAWETRDYSNGNDAALNVTQTRKTMDEAADAICVMLAALHGICEPITVMGDADTVSACKDLHELLAAHAKEAIAKVSPSRPD